VVLGSTKLRTSRLEESSEADECGHRIHVTRGEDCEQNEDHEAQ